MDAPQSTEEREPEVARALDEQMGLVVELSEILDRVFDRFSKVLRSEPNASAQGQKDVEESGVPLVSDLRERTAIIKKAITRLQVLLDLCEL